MIASNEETFSQLASQKDRTMNLRFHPGRILAMASAVLLIIASFLPWAKMTILTVSTSVSGIQGDGKIQVGIAIVVLVLLAFPKIKTWIPMVFVIISGLVAALDYNNIANANAKLGGIGEFAFGFYLVLLAIFGLLAGCVWALFGAPSKKPSQSALTSAKPDLAK